MTSYLLESNTSGSGSKLNMPSGVPSDTELPESLEGDLLGVVIFGFLVWEAEIDVSETDECRVDGYHSKTIVFPSFVLIR